MKIRIAFKTPDALDRAIIEEVHNEACRTELMEDTQEELDGLMEELEEEARSACEKFIRNGEYVTIEIDTETEKATVVPVK